MLESLPLELEIDRLCEQLEEEADENEKEQLRSKLDDVMARHQATLGYVRDGQLTLGWVIPGC